MLTHCRDESFVCCFKIMGTIRTFSHALRVLRLVVKISAEEKITISAMNCQLSCFFKMCLFHEFSPADYSTIFSAYPAATSDKERGSNCLKRPWWVYLLIYPWIEKRIVCSLIEMNYVCVSVFFSECFVQSTLNLPSMLNKFVVYILPRLGEKVL